MSPSVEQVRSTTGLEFEIVFSSEMDEADPALLDLASYALATTLGVTPTLLTVAIGTLSPNSHALSVLVGHTGTTLGGSYLVTVNGPSDIFGTVLEDPAVPDPLAEVQINEGRLLARGRTSSFTATPQDGASVLLDFDEDLLPAAQEPAGSTGIEDAASYGISATPSYPIPLTVEALTHPFGGDASKILLEVKGQTSLDYTVNVSPSEALSYDGTLPPDADPGFSALEVNPSGGSSQISSGLSITKGFNESYGWVFEDTSGQVVPNLSSFKVDLTFDVSSTSFNPPLSLLSSPTVATFQVEDSAPGDGVLIAVSLSRSALDVDQITVTSGAFEQTLAVPWSSSGTHVLSVLRNRKAALYAVLFDGDPVLSVPLVDMTAQASVIGGAGAAFVLSDEAHITTGFLIQSLIYRATNTVWTASWNFIHDLEATFTGSAQQARDTYQTQRGPLVKSWGDATPATVADVTVKVAGVAVEVAEINPYTGLIRTAIPIPLMPMGDPLADVKVNYQWFPNPIMSQMRLGKPGMTLGKWDRRQGGHLPPASPGAQVQTLPDFPKGSVQTSRFQFSLTLGGGSSLSRPAPLSIGHRYHGLERAYSAVLGSPSSLRLGRNPALTQVEGYRRVPDGVTASFEGVLTPQDSSPPWDLLGTDVGAVDINQGTFTVIDAQVGGFDPPTSPPVALYGRGLDLTFPSALTVVARYKVSSSVPDGVFAGVAFGGHDNRRLYLVGNLVVHGLEHVGLLLDPLRPHVRESWDIGPQATGTVLSASTIRFQTALLPLGLKVGHRFQVFEGGQAGTYTISTRQRLPDGTTLVGVSPAFGADPALYGNKYPKVYFEVLWGGAAPASTYRMDINPGAPGGAVEVRVSGALSGLVSSRVGGLPIYPEPAQTSLVLSTAQEGGVFWGALSTRTTSTSVWSFVRYGVVPDHSAFSAQGALVLTEMGVEPENDPNNEWFRVQDFGVRRIDGVQRLLLTSDVADPALPLTHGYKRLEPFFDSKSIMDLRATFLLESGTLGAGDALIRFGDTRQQVDLATILYIEVPGELDHRRLLQLPSVSASGIRTPTTESGWAPSSPQDVTFSARASTLTMTQGAGLAGGFHATLDMSNYPVTDEGSRILETRLGIDSYVETSTGRLGLLFGADVGVFGAYRFVGLMFKAPFGGNGAKVQLVTAGQSPVQEYDLDWDDQVVRQYRLIADVVSGTLVLSVDDQVLTPTLALTAFSGGSGNTAVFFGAVALDATVEVVANWEAVSVAVAAPVEAIRTLGVWLGGDRGQINSWELPRTDTSTAPNSAETGPVIEPVDWRQPTKVRVLRDPQWGVTVYFPDKGLPPFYEPETDGVTGSGFATQITEPSAGWINVEYPHIPKAPSTFGSVSFGALDSGSISRQRWEFVRYQFFKNLTDDFRAPQRMVLGRAHVITSGERGTDTTLESVSVQALDSTRVSLRPARLNASHVFKVVDGQVSLTPDMWIFDPGTQVLTLQEDSEGNPRTFSSSNAALTMVFSPGLPVTSTYLQGQPQQDSVTLLNEGTPPFPKSQLVTTQRQVTSGSVLGNTFDLLGSQDFRLGDPYRVISLQEDPDALYQSMDFFESLDAGQVDHISIICEGTVGEGVSGWIDGEGGDIIYTPGGDPDFVGVGEAEDLLDTGATTGSAAGAFVIELSGTLFFQGGVGLADITLEQGGGAPGKYLFAGGGSFVGPVVDSGGVIQPQMVALGGLLNQAMLWPNGPSAEGGGRAQQSTSWSVLLESVLTDTTDLGALVEVALEESLDEAQDAAPPTFPIGWQESPDGAVGNGEGSALMVQDQGGDYARIGPWGGMVALSAQADRLNVVFQAVVQDGATITIRERDLGPDIVFVARTVPVLSNEFTIGASAHTELADLINAEAQTSLWVRAVAQVNLSGLLGVVLWALDPTGPGLNLSVETSDVTSVRVHEGLLVDPEEGLIFGGAKIQQVSLMGGGGVTLNQGVHDPLRGMLCAGGSALPAGSQTRLLLTTA